MRNENKLVAFALVALMAAVATAAPKNAPKKDAPKEAPPAAAATDAPKEPEKSPKNADIAAARVHFGAGKQFYKESRYDDAIREFRDAYKYDPNPLLLYNLAQAYEKAALIPDALQYYRRYIHDSPTAPDRKTVEIAIGNLEQRMVEKGVQLVTVFSTPDGAMVAIDGTVQGPTPLGANLKPGRHKLSVSLAAYKTLERDFGLTAGRALDIDVHLESGSGLITADPLGDLPALLPPELALNDEPVKPVPTPAAVAGADAQKAATTPPAPPAPSAMERITARTWGAFGVAVVAAAVGAGLQLSKQSVEAAAAKENVQLKYIDLSNQAHARVSSSRVTFGVCAAGVLAGGTFLLLDLGAL